MTEAIWDLQSIKYLLSGSLQKKVYKPLCYMLVITHPISAKKYSLNQEVLMGHKNCSLNHLPSLGGLRKMEQNSRRTKGNHNHD